MRLAKSVLLVHLVLAPAQPLIGQHFPTVGLAFAVDKRAVLHQPDLCGAGKRASKPCARLREVMVPSVLRQVKDVAKPARKSAETGLDGEESGNDAREKNQSDQ
ncbi:hypothetical protein [Delftia lacustris]|uniref:hypothetical protein n=1 Tax=Delftia lacustris TaxID=558537 RepID=UPI0035A6D5E1